MGNLLRCRGQLNLSELKSKVTLPYAAVKFDLCVQKAELPNGPVGLRCLSLTIAKRPIIHGLKQVRNLPATCGQSMVLWVL